MDSADPAEGIDPFSRVLPLPFRLQFELILGFWLWGLNLHGFHRLHVDIFSLIRYPPRPTSSSTSSSSSLPTAPSSSDDAGEPPLHTSTYRLAALLTTAWAFAITAFWLLTRGDAAAVVAHAWIPNLLTLVLLGLLCTPRWPALRRALGGGGGRNSSSSSSSSSNAGVSRLGSGLRRIAIGGIAKPKPEKFGDVLLADALTSYAKPLSEVVVTLCMFARGVATTARPDRRCGHEWAVPLAIAWPFAVRLRQCLKEGQWANAAKYATAFPVIALSTMARGDEGLTIAWRLAAIVNSVYSFWWDVSMDWDLTLLSSSRHVSPYGLRQHRVFVRPMLYYSVVVFDLILRFAWSMKLSLHLVYLDGIEGGIFLMEIFELCRRWVWVYFRVETEWVRSMPSANIEL